MTTPAPSSVDTGSFGGYPYPPDVVARIINLLIDSAPFAASLTRQPTNRASVAWPTAKPSGFAWLDELQPFPTVTLADDAYVVAVAKIGGIIDLSNESVADPSFNVTTAMTGLLRDSLSRDLDLGLLNGGGPPEPVGVIGVAANVTGADLLEAVAKARGQIADAGGSPTTIALSGTALADADTSRDANGQLVYPSGFAAAAGLDAVVVPGLGTPLVYDRARCYVVRRDSDDATVEISRDWHFHLDATSVRVKARVAAAIPDPGKAIRKLEITEPGARAARGGKAS
jgi:HK97 family phage major capsid protein